MAVAFTPPVSTAGSDCSNLPSTGSCGSRCTSLTFPSRSSAWSCSSTTSPSAVARRRGRSARSSPLLVDCACRCAAQPARPVAVTAGSCRFSPSRCSRSTTGRPRVRARVAPANGQPDSPTPNPRRHSAGAPEARLKRSGATSVDSAVFEAECRPVQRPTCHQATVPRPWPPA
jgi:hypothetical protein